MTIPDSKARKILFDAFWTSHGWRMEGDRRIDSADFEIAKKAGVMFDPMRVRHDEVVRNLRAVIARCNPDRIAQAFAASFSSRQVELRSALGSYAFAKNFPAHRYEKWESQCGVCGLYPDRDEDEDLNVLNFERMKWGGVRHTNPLYAWFDLRQFASLETPEPAEEDVNTLNVILDIARAAPKEATIPALERALSKAFKSNKSERGVVVDILGLCGILETREHRGYWECYAKARDRALPPWHNVDHAYPGCWWRGSDGVNEEAARVVFGKWLK